MRRPQTPMPNVRVISAEPAPPPMVPPDSASLTALLEELATAREALTRITRGPFPMAAQVAIRVDHSHDDPHGHIHTIQDADGAVLADGATKEWLDDDHTIAIDEAAYDWYACYQVFIKNIGYTGVLEDVTIVTLNPL